MPQQSCPLTLRTLEVASGNSICRLEIGLVKFLAICLFYNCQDSVVYLIELVLIANMGELSLRFDEIYIYTRSYYTCNPTQCFFNSTVVWINCLASKRSFDLKSMYAIQLEM